MDQDGSGECIPVPSAVPKMFEYGHDFRTLLITPEMDSENWFPFAFSFPALPKMFE
jgi:hypothetical protein